MITDAYVAQQSPGTRKSGVKKERLVKMLLLSSVGDGGTMKQSYDA